MDGGGLPEFDLQRAIHIAHARRRGKGVADDDTEGGDGDAADDDAGGAPPPEGAASDNNLLRRILWPYCRGSPYFRNIGMLKGIPVLSAN